MAQAEDTELRDLVIEALEKNGSLAKIRALLRANVLLAFEDDFENIKQNVSLDNILKLPEGKLALSLIHEFLELCNLKNTLFVYMAESRQKRDYFYEGSQKLREKVSLAQCSQIHNAKEPILVTLLRNISHQKNYSDLTDNHNLKVDDNKDEQNCSYIVHEDFSTAASSNSQSGNSSDEKNKLHLRLQIDNSDTETSSDSVRDKSCSEYIPNEHILFGAKHQNIKLTEGPIELPSDKSPSNMLDHISLKKGTHSTQGLKLSNNSSSDSTSYLDLKSINTTRLNNKNNAGQNTIGDLKEESTDYHTNTTEFDLAVDSQKHISNDIKIDSASSATLSMGSLLSPGNSSNKKDVKSPVEESAKSDAETAGYTYDFTGSTLSKNKEPYKPTSADSMHKKSEVESPDKNTFMDSPHQNSQSSQSSVSISDVADLISESYSSYYHTKKTNKIHVNETKLYQTRNKSYERRKLSDDSTEFSESPIPSLSNLSLDIHSD